MARGQQKGIGSVTVWMIVFVALWLSSTVLLVILYTGQEELSKENTILADDNRMLISPPERNSLAVFRSSKKGGQTVVGLLEAARGQTAELATGEAADDIPAVQSKLEEQLLSIRDGGLVASPKRYRGISYDEALSNLYEAFSAQHAQLKSAKDRVAELEAETDRLVQAGAETRNDFEKRALGIGDQLAAAESERAEKLRQRDDSIERLSGEYEDRRQRSDADLARERRHVADLTDQLAQLRRRFSAYREKFGELLIGPEELATAREPDGIVLSAVPGDGVIYVNLGQKDAVTLGLQFTVYPKETGIPADGLGKARIEVVSISRDSSQCKIVRQFGYEPILEDDLIANPIYDRDRPLSFMVVGAFDMDHDGLMDRDGSAGIESLVTGWGGTLSSELTALTDFLVLGGSPRRPKPDRDSSGEQSERFLAQKRLFDHYNETVELARSLSIPVLPQEVFLNFLGYAGR